MAKIEYASSTVLSTGTPIFILNDSTMNIERIILYVASSAAETSVGYWDSSVNFTGGSAYGDENDTKSLTHYRNIGGVKTKVFECTVTNLWTGEFQLDVTTCTQQTQIRFVVYGS